jgi:phospholipid transport system transporter-binding protein
VTALFSRSSITADVEGATLKVVGDVDVTLAADLAASGVKWLRHTELTSIAFDFSGVEKATSVTISVLFEWLRVCQQRSIRVQSIRFSEPLIRLASLAELDDLIQQPEAVMAI